MEGVYVGEEAILASEPHASLMFSSRPQSENTTFSTGLWLICLHFLATIRLIHQKTATQC